MKKTGYITSIFIVHKESEGEENEEGGIEEKMGVGSQ